MPAISQLFQEVSYVEAQAVLIPLVVFILGMVAYAVFVFKFYRFIARKDIFELHFEKFSESKYRLVRKCFHLIFYIIKYVFLFPLFTIFWFGILSMFLTFLSKSQQIDNILLTSMAVVAAIRITAYYHEALSQDLAKMLPFALLGVFLIDISYFDPSKTWVTLKQIPSFWKILIYYSIFVIVLEFLLRVAHSIFNPLLNILGNEEEEEKIEVKKKKKLK